MHYACRVRRARRAAVRAVVWAARTPAHPAHLPELPLAAGFMIPWSQLPAYWCVLQRALWVLPTACSRLAPCQRFRPYPYLAAFAGAGMPSSTTCATPLAP